MMARMSPVPPARRATLATLVLTLLACLWAAASAAGAGVTVAPGDTLSGIAARNGVSVAALVRANGISDPDQVTAGRRLVLPGSGGSSGGAGGSYRVRAGDSLSAIAARHGVSVSAIAAANGIRNPNLLVAGRRLTIPSRGSGGRAVSGGGGGRGSSYRVRPGDTLGGIAARHGTTTSALAARNGIRAPYLIAIGRVLRVPAAAPRVSKGTSPVEVRNLIARHAARYGVNAALARAIAWQESGWNQSVRSRVGAIGVMQLMPVTARWLGSDIVGRRLDPRLLEDNIEGGVAYLAWLRRHAGGTRRAVAAYYQGLASLRARGPYDDTTTYVASVLALIGRV